MRPALLILFVGILVSLSSCKHSYSISVKEPAVIRIPENVKTFGVINNVSDENSPEKIVSTMLATQQVNGNVVAAERAIDGVIQSFNNTQDMRGQIFEIDSSYFLANGKLNWTMLDSAAAIEGIDGFIELTELRSISPVGGTVLANATKQTQHRLKGTLFVNVHVVETGITYERYGVNYTYNIELSGSTSIISILNDIQRKREYYRALGFQLGFKAGKLIYPNWVWVGRTYYTRGTPGLKSAKKMLREGNWQLAERRLLMEIDHAKRSKRGRILHNLALAKEGQGEIDAAIDYAERAALECDDKLANEYLVKLRERKRIMEQL